MLDKPKKTGKNSRLKLSTYGTQMKIKGETRLSLVSQ